MRKLFSILLGLAVLFLTACVPDPLPEGGVNVGKGVFVISEGNYGFANSTLAFYNPTTDTSANNLFYRVNGAPIGDTGESLTLLDGKLYIVVNGSKYIYKMDAKTLLVDTLKPYKLTDFVSPRYMQPVSSTKAYVTDIASSSLWIINPKTMTHTGTVDMGKATETMVLVGRDLFITNWSRYYFPTTANNSVQVVNVDSDTKVADIEVGYEPNGMVVDKNGFIWVLCEGDVNDPSVPSTLWKIDPQSKTSTLIQTFEKKALNLAIDPTGNYLYTVYGGDWVVGGDVRRINIDNPSAFDDFVIPAEGRQFYKVFVDPENGDLYLSDAKNYAMDGTVYRYSSKGELISSFDAGISPGFMLFN